MKQQFDLFDYLIKTKDIIGYFKHHYKPIKDLVIDDTTYWIVGKIEFYIIKTKGKEEYKLYYDSVEIIDSEHLSLVFQFHNYEQQKEKDNFI